LVAFVVAGAAAAQTPAGPDIAGAWSTTFGDTYFNVTERRNAQGRVIARDVVAPYKGESGTLKGELKGAVLTGYWTEPGSSVRCQTARDGGNHWGRFSFTFNPESNLFDGKWGYCDDAPARGWSGHRKGALAAAAPAGGAGLAANQRQAAPAPQRAQAAPRGGSGCAGANQAQQSTGRSILGGLAASIGGQLLDRQMSKMRIPYDYGLRSTVHGLLVDSIACLLSPRERQQAAQATEQVVQQGVGARREWTSTERPGVTGSSTVTAENTRADGGLCRTVSDVVIVDGEETTVQKRMCRNPGASGFTLVT
jgi:surface antigen